MPLSVGIPLLCHKRLTTEMTGSILILADILFSFQHHHAWGWGGYSRAVAQTFPHDASLVS